jgi:hypothetical protein
MRRLAFPLLVGLVAAPCSAQAGAWSREFGSVYAKLEAGAYIATEYVDPSREEPVQGRFVGERTSLYAEVGVLPWHPLQVTLSVPFATVGTVWFADERRFGPGAEARATSFRAADLEVGLQTSLLPKTLPVKLSASFAVKVPMYANDRVGEEFGVWKDAFPLPGDGQVDLTGLLLVGGSVPGAIAPWFEGGVGYRHRTEAFVDYTTDRELVDGIPFFGLAGLKLPSGWLLVRADALLNVEPDDDTREGLSVGLQGAVELGEGFSFEARFGGEPWVNASSRGISFGLGLSWQR